MEDASVVADGEDEALRSQLPFLRTQVSALALDDCLIRSSIHLKEQQMKENEETACCLMVQVRDETRQRQEQASAQEQHFLAHVCATATRSDDRREAAPRLLEEKVMAIRQTCDRLTQLRPAAPQLMPHH